MSTCTSIYINLVLQSFATAILDRSADQGEDKEEDWMGNSLRCCLACVLPCGALDVVRIVHVSGQVDEYSRQVSAGEVLAANPKHVISKPCCYEGAARKILIVSPESDLKRGHIYFLIPESAFPGKGARKKKMKKEQGSGSDDDVVNVQEVALREEKACRRRRRSGRVGVWRPHLEIIAED